MLATLQAGRALAAIAVAAFHLSIMMASPRYGGTHVFEAVTRYGKHGVDFFFVLSGFIILLAHARDLGQPRAWTRYLYRRFVRVYPVYWLYTLVFVAVLMVAGGTDATMPDSAVDWLSSLSLLRFSAAAPPLGQAWTLFHEIAFYFVFSLLILNRKLGLVALAGFVAAGIVLHPETQDGARTALNVYTSAYNLYFVFGMLAFLSYRRGGKGLVEMLAGVLAALAVVLVLPWRLALSPLVLAAGLALMLAGVSKLEQAGMVAVPRWLAFVGNASYSIYLTHINVEGLLLKMARRLQVDGMMGAELRYTVLLAATVGLGCLAYVLVERPLLALLAQRRVSGGARRLRLREQATRGR